MKGPLTTKAPTFLFFIFIFCDKPCLCLQTRGAPLFTMASCSQLHLATCIPSSSTKLADSFQIATGSHGFKCFLLVLFNGGTRLWQWPAIMAASNWLWGGGSIGMVLRCGRTCASLFKLHCDADEKGVDVLWVLGVWPAGAARLCWCGNSIFGLVGVCWVMGS